MTSVRLTDLAHGGGCGCKLAPAVLQELLAGKPAAMPFAQLLVGTESSDDAAVWQVDERTCVIATTDFFMPVVDDPYDFGRIAATNALSDVYAMGGKPIMALAILGMPLGKLDIDTVRAILAGGEAVCAQAGIPIVRIQKLLGHSTPAMTFRYMNHAPENYFVEDAARVAASLSGTADREANAQAELARQGLKRS